MNMNILCPGAIPDGVLMTLKCHRPFQPPSGRRAAREIVAASYPPRPARLASLIVCCVC